MPARGTGLKLLCRLVKFDESHPVVEQRWARSEIQIIRMSYSAKLAVVAGCGGGLMFAERARTLMIIRMGGAKGGLRGGDILVVPLGSCRRVVRPERRRRLRATQFCEGVSHAEMVSLSSWCGMFLSCWKWLLGCVEIEEG